MNQPTSHLAVHFLSALTLLAFAGCSSNGDDSDSDEREPVSRQIVTLRDAARESLSIGLGETATVRFSQADADHTWRNLPSNSDESVVRITRSKAFTGTDQSFTIRGARTGRETVEFVQTPAGKPNARPTARATIEVRVGG